MCEQCIVWYIDDNKISHKDPEVVTEVIEIMKKYFGDLSVTRSKEHRVLGMNTTIIDDRNLNIDIKEHLHDTIDIFSQLNSKEIVETVAYPARHQLIKAREEFTELSSEKRKDFHSIVAELLWIMKRSRPDLETAIGFLCTRVDKSENNDWKITQGYSIY